MRDEKLDAVRDGGDGLTVDWYVRRRQRLWQCLWRREKLSKTEEEELADSAKHSIVLPLRNRHHRGGHR